MTSQEATGVIQRRIDVVLATHPAPGAGVAVRLSSAVAAAGAELVLEEGPTLTIRGDAASVLALLGGRYTGGERLIGDDASTSVTAEVTGVTSVKAATISNHMQNAAQNKPPEDAALDIRTEHDEAHGHLTVRLSGSLHATTYLLFLVYLQMTQSRT